MKHHLEVRKIISCLILIFLKEQPQLAEDELVDDVLVRGTRTLNDVYQQCNWVISEPISYVVV